jgi:hypothetical protein
VLEWNRSAICSLHLSSPVLLSNLLFLSILAGTETPPYFDYIILAPDEIIVLSADRNGTCIKMFKKKWQPLWYVKHGVSR